MVPLGELIYLDRERCIQCARCIRFQDEIAGESVLGFDERGRNTQIISFQSPGLIRSSPATPPTFAPSVR
jgi:NADH-quinone oxidoreductase subunit G